MKRRSFQIALSAVSCALAGVFMIIGLNVPFAFVTGYIFAEVALMLPLAKNFRAGGALAYAAASLLCLPLGGLAMFYKLFPFIAFFGLHPLVNKLTEKIKCRPAVLIGEAVWFVGMLAAAWALFSHLFELPFDWLEKWAYPVIVVGGGGLFFVYDWLMRKAQKLVSYYVAKIDRSGGQSTAAPRSGTREDVGDVFEELAGPESEKSETGAEPGANRNENGKEGTDSDERQ